MVVTIPLMNFALVVDVGFAASHLALVLAVVVAVMIASVVSVLRVVVVAIVVVILSHAHRGR